MGSELVASVSDAGPGVGLPRAGLQGAECWQSHEKERESMGHFCPLPVSQYNPTLHCHCPLFCLSPALFPGCNPKGLPLLSRG